MIHLLLKWRGGNFLSGFHFWISFDLHRDNVMPCILVPFVKEIVGDFIFQAEVLNELSLGHCFRLIVDEKPFEITAAIHIVYVLNYSSEGRGYYSGEQYFIFGHLLLKFGWYRTISNASPVHALVSLSDYLTIASLIQSTM